MIQRIQTIYLLVAGALLAALFALPFATTTPTTDGPLADGDFDVQDNVALLALVIAIVSINVLTIFLFKNRKLQMNLNRFLMIAIIGLLATAAILCFNLGTSIGVGLGFFPPVIAMVLLFLANKAIHKDETLVKSMDRIR